MLIFELFSNNYPSPLPMLIWAPVYLLLQRKIFYHLQRNWRYQYKHFIIKISIIEYFVFACLDSLLNIYYKYIIFRFFTPSTRWLRSPIIKYPGNFLPTLLLRPPSFIWHSRVNEVSSSPSLCIKLTNLLGKESSCKVILEIWKVFRRFQGSCSYKLWLKQLPTIFLKPDN